jgi:predicted RecB family nuclease
MSENSKPITASMLYDFIACPHRVSMDAFEDPGLRDDVSPFVQLLWDRGHAHEVAIMADLAVPFLDLSMFHGEEKETRTLEAMDQGVDLIYSGRISADGLLGVPDILRRQEGGYVAGDIKSGAGEEGGVGDDDTKPKVSYAVQLGLYTDILQRLGRSTARSAFVWDINRNEVTYDFNEQYGKKNSKSLWDHYQECLADVRAIIAGAVVTLPAYSSACKNCVWYSTCLKRLEEANDLTLIFMLGRAKRDVMIDQIATLRALAEINPEGFFTDKGKKTIFPGIGPDSLRKYQARALLAVTKDAKPYLTAAVSLPSHERELFFDIEVDPMRDICYLHGFVERLRGTEQYTAFFSERANAEGEKQAFRDAWSYLQSRKPCAIYYYSKYERTIYRKLQAKYPDVCSVGDIEALFADTAAVDLLYDIVTKVTEWPTKDYSLKTLAKFLGFAWRDVHPSGAASIEWFDKWVQFGEPAVRNRILEYNEDDCRATRILLDGLREMAS